MDLTPDQLQQLKNLGLEISNPPTTTSKDIPKYGQIPISAHPSTHPNGLLSIVKTPLFPLFSISGLTLISFGGLLLLKGNSEKASVPPTENRDLTSDQLPEPTQVPKSIQHYLLASQQFFTSALQIQNSCTGSPGGCPSSSDLPNLINQSILSATQAIQEFPEDHRGYIQRASIYQALIDSKPEYLDLALADYSQASTLNPGSAEITRSLASLFARKGDANNTLQYLARTVALEPTKAQNFYDLARVQQQTGQIDGALESYTRLLTIVSDPAQKSQVQTEVDSLQKLASQNTTLKISPTSYLATPKPTGEGWADSPSLIQADSGAGLIIAAPETKAEIKVNNITDSNSLSGTATLAANQTQISLTNQNLTPDSKIYLSIVQGGVNKSLQVLSRSGTTFSVGLDSAISEDIVFKWWIVN